MPNRAVKPDQIASVSVTGAGVHAPGGCGAIFGLILMGAFCPVGALILAAGLLDDSPGIDEVGAPIGGAILIFGVIGIWVCIRDIRAKWARLFVVCLSLSSGERADSPRLRRGEAETVLSRVRAAMAANASALAARSRPSPAPPRTPESDGKECPMCAEMVRARAKICRFCRHVFVDDDDHSLPAPAATTTAPSHVALVLVDCGEKKIQTIKLIREVTGLGLKKAKTLTETPDATVLGRVAVESAERIREKFEAVGATVALRTWR